MKQLIITLLILMSVAVHGQLRHVKGSSTIGAGGGYIKDGYSLSGSYAYLLRDNLKLRANGVYEAYQLDQSNAQSIYFNPELIYTIKSVNQVLFFNIKGGLIAGNEQIKNSILNQSKSEFLFGESLGIEMEYYLSTKWSLNIGADQHFLQKEITGSKSYVAYLTLNMEL